MPGVVVPALPGGPIRHQGTSGATSLGQTARNQFRQQLPRRGQNAFPGRFCSDLAEPENLPFFGSGVLIHGDLMGI